MATTLEAMVAAAKAVVPALTAEQVQANIQAGEPFVILDVQEKVRIRPGAYCPGPVAAARMAGISYQ
jgi:hypothetical protein